MKQIYTKTMRFQLMKLLPGLASLILAILLFVPVKLWCDNGLLGVGRFLILLVWAGISAFGYYLIVHYFGYLFRTAFMAAAAEYAVNQALPTSYRDFVQEFVKTQFKKPADFLYLYRLVGQAVKDVHEGSYQKNKLMLDYLTMCCICINFYKKKAGKYKTMADAVVLFAKNQKKLMAQSQKTTVVIAVTVAVVTLVLWLILSAVPVLNWFAALVLSLIIAGALKNAFLDSWFLTRQLLVCGRLEQMGAEQSYEELSNSSRAFRKLYHKVRREQSSLDVRPTEFDFHSLKFCGECGALVAPEAEGDEKEVANEIDEQETPVEKGDQDFVKIFSETGQTNEKDQGMDRFEENGFGTSDDRETSGESMQKDGAGSQENNETEQASAEKDKKENQKVVFCGECGTAVFPEDAFCGECGTPVERKETKTKFCGECGAALEAGEAFCGECGTKAE